MSYKRLKPRVLLSIGLPAILVAGIVTFISVQGSSAQRLRTPRVDTRPKAALVQHFGILRRSHFSQAQNETALPERMVKALSRHATPAFGLDIGDAQLARPESGATLWLVPGSKGACVVDQLASDAYATACDGVGSADSPILLQAGSKLVGFVPDGGSVVSMANSEGATVASATVVSNAFAITAPTGSMVLRYTNAAGSQSEPVTIAGPGPASVYGYSGAGE